MPSYVQKMAYPSALVGYWPLNSKHGARDVSGYGNDAVQHDTGLAEGPGGEVGGSFYFKGIFGSRLDIPNNGALQTGPYMTMLAWIYPEGNRGPIFSYQRNFPQTLWDYGASLWIDSNPSMLATQFWGQDGYKIKSLWNEVIKQGEWQFVSATYSLTTGLVKVYWNGTEVASEDQGSLDLASQTHFPVVMAGKPAAKDGKKDERNYKGRIAHMQVYNIALTQEQIKEAMERTKGGYD
ncbi:uncharacterized protein LOC118411131 [Branchiostoma floridae]|uniref:Uncharacterized protein LOC118411131 n=1 Tax=Branchiostoma floridae TaxID=7739 RepID=A0A9J7MJF2_BRAFL|nr:uncharacterized protein LOC118411131 [Branchiostoma floridae]